MKDFKAVVACVILRYWIRETSQTEKVISPFAPDNIICEVVVHNRDEQRELKP